MESQVELPLMLATPMQIYNHKMVIASTISALAQTTDKIMSKNLTETIKKV